MPLYDYKCSRCGFIFEARKGMNEEVKDLTCPKCTSSSVKRVFGGFRIGKEESDLLDETGTSVSSCDTCVSGVCSSCSVKR